MTRTTIALDTATRDHLKRFGTHGQTYDEILQRLMGEMERRDLYDEARHLQANQDRVPWLSRDEVWKDL